MINIKEYNIPEQVLTILLQDHTTHTNILWGTDQYGFNQKTPILLEQIISGDVIKPRVAKSQDIQKARTDDKAEVFTPLSIVKKMNDQLDDSACSVDEYIRKTVLEVTCGEAPFLVSRYDVATGMSLSLNQREGFLDRKLRLVTEKKYATENEWLTDATIALKSIYAYEWQGDSLLIARENILLDMNDWFSSYFGKSLSNESMLEFAKIISNNIIQMDGVTCCIPYSDTPARVMNWEENVFERFDNKPDEVSLF